MRGLSNERERSFAPRAADGVGDLAAVRAVGGGLIVERAAAVAVVGAALDPHIRAGNATFEEVPQTVAGCSSRHDLDLMEICFAF